MADSPTGRCCLCGNTYVNYGNNAQPLDNGRCCDMCNMTKVIPARMSMPIDHQPHRIINPNRNDS